MLEERAATWPKQWMAEGYRQGRRKGRQEGRQTGRQEGHSSGLLEGQRVALAEQMAAKFGRLEARYQALIEKASADQLKDWLKGILTASSAADLFRE